jgi:aryl-alcohol dehydrogenase|tara:strand:+ start:1376 stop:2482 length:1107 start_codon:yes stop_codon:yes gene_type:complete
MEMEIKAAIVRQKNGPFLLEHVALNEPAEDQVLVRLVATGLCHTDLVCRDQHYPVPLPMVFGHEGAGVVERVGSAVKKVQPGDHVVLTFYTCGSCDACLSGDPTSCANSFGPNFMGRSVTGECTIHDHQGAEVGASFFGQSSFATYALSYERNTVKVTKDVPLELLGPLGCGIQTGAGSVLNALNPPAGSAIAIFGAGAVGLSAVMASVVAGCTTIIAVDVKENRLELANELGATHIINAAANDPIEAIKEIFAGGVPYVLETSGLPAVLTQAILSSAIGGEIGIVGAPPMGATVPVDINFLLFNRKLRGIVEGQSISDIFIPRLVELYRQGKFPFDKLIKFYPFDEINRAAEDSEKGVTLKPVLRIG